MHEDLGKKKLFFKKHWWKFLAVVLVIATFIVFSHGIEPVQVNKPERNVVVDESQNSDNCQNENKIKFGASPIDLNNLAAIYPMGRMDPGSGHVAPTDHQYWLPKGITKDSTLESNPTLYKISAPGKGILSSIEHQTQVLSGSMKVDDYRLIFDYPCGIHSAYMHVNTLSPDIEREFQINKKSLNEGREFASVKIPVDEGEVIGTTGTHNFDFMVWDDSLTLPGFVNPNDYNSENWKPHIIDPFNIFIEPLRSSLIEKSVRKVAPFGGKIDYDIDGKLVGTWFREGSGGYAGSIAQGKIGNYWDGHLSIAYNEIDPKYIIISSGSGGLFAVKNNMPDPADIGKSSGMIKYELVYFDLVTADGAKWDFSGPSYENVSVRTYSTATGVAAFQMLDDRKLKAEFFPGETIEQVNGFDDKALTYVR